jgi:membrane protein
MDLEKLYKRFVHCEVSIRASALAYHTLLGIVPAVGISFWYLKSIQLTDRYFSLTRNFVLSQLNIGSSQVFEKYFDKLTGQVAGNSWGWIGLVLLIYTVWNLIAKFGQSLDFIVTSQARQQKHDLVHAFWLTFRRLFVMAALPIALMLSVIMTQWIRKDSVFHRLFEMKAVGPVFALPLAWLSSIVAFSLVYYFVPRVKVPWRQAIKAALIVAPVSELVRFLFGVYNSYAVSVHKIYGVLAVVPLFILWVQISWTLLLVGALFIRVPSTLTEA